MTTTTQHATATTATAKPAARLPLRRTCACGTHTPLGGECAGCRKKKVQAKFAVGAANDAFEREADAVADRVMGDAAPGSTSPAPVAVQRAADRATDGADAPASVDAVLAHGGAPLDSMLRADMEARFGHDFSHVRTHTDAAAERSAQEIDAAAYTAGHHVVFGRGRYAPSTTGGRRLIAHELTHVLQQTPSPGAGVVRRKGVTFGGFFGNLFRFWRYGPDALQEYLGVLDKTGDIEDDHDSDDKARQIVEDWKKGNSPYVLTHERKALLIREMQSGATGDDDELAILELLERSYAYELAHIFGKGGVTADALIGDFHGEEETVLLDFFERRFVGGLAALRAGKVEPTGTAATPGTKMPMYVNYLEQEIEGGSAAWNVACVLGLLCSEDRAVVDELRKVKVQVAEEIIEHYWEFDGSDWKPRTRDRGAAHGSGGDVILKREHPCAYAAYDIIHEIRHHGQAATMPPLDKETDAYTFGEQWAIDRGMPGRLDFRQRPEGATKSVVDTAAIDTYVRNRYSGLVSGQPNDRITGHRGKEAEITHPDGSTDFRPAAVGESHQDVAKTAAGLANLPVIDPKRWQCPEGAAEREAKRKAQAKSAGKAAKP
ncbi:DUF4157 domain-containing protein [Tahibacter sp. UC22_41]|uniref:eCIS core domain-containing protein n=1 Tax=Tahibacter sp. UC22_41 TaxID=3350178 RepID=UPI0036D92240